MSEDTKGGGATADKSGAQTGAENKDKKVVPFDDHDRALKDLHKFKALAKELESKVQETEQSKLMAEGKKDELIANLQKSVTELKTKHAETQKKYAWDKVQGWIKTKAVTSGITAESGAVEKFAALVDFKGRNPFRDESTFDIEETVLSQVFEDAKKDMPYFFSKPMTQVKDVNPNNGPVVPGGADYSKMSLDEMRAHARKQN